MKTATLCTGERDPFGRPMVAGAGIRVEEFRFDVAGREAVAVTVAQPKANLSSRPSLSLPFTLYANYGRGISTTRRGAALRAARGRDHRFLPVGSSQQPGRLSTSLDAFWIDRSNEHIYIPDDGSFEFKGPSRSYGFEAKASLEITHRLSLNAGLTKVANSFYLGTSPRIYEDSARTSPLRPG